MHETRTAGVAADKLRKAGYDVTTGVGKTGVVGVLRNGEGPTVMLRADMAIGHDYSYCLSQPGTVGSAGCADGCRARQP
jgi:hypothetical protein